MTRLAASSDLVRPLTPRHSRRKIPSSVLKMIMLDMKTVQPAKAKLPLLASADLIEGELRVPDGAGGAGQQQVGDQRGAGLEVIAAAAVLEVEDTGTRGS